jgi:hypothetical protein
MMHVKMFINNDEREMDGTGQDGRGESSSLYPWYGWGSSFMELGGYPFVGKRYGKRLCSISQLVLDPLLCFGYIPIDTQTCP